MKFESGSKVLTPGNEQESPTFHMNVHGYIEFQKSPPEIVKDLDNSHITSLIEKCLELYLNEEEIVACLEASEVPAELTKKILSRLELRNPQFFQYYQLQLQIKDQITRFNSAVAKQADVLATAGLPMSQAFGLAPPPVRRHLQPTSCVDWAASASHSNLTSPFELESSPGDLQTSDLPLFGMDTKLERMAMSSQELPL